MNHRPRKRFGQNFLQARHVIHKIVESIGPAPDDRQGAITQDLLRAVGSLDVVE